MPSVMKYVVSEGSIMGWWQVWSMADPSDETPITGQGFFTLDEICIKSGKKYKEFPEKFITHNDR